MAFALVHVRLLETRDRVKLRFAPAASTISFHSVDEDGLPWEGELHLRAVYCSYTREMAEQDLCLGLVVLCIMNK